MPLPSLSALLTESRDAWLALQPFRDERRRCKNLAYGVGNNAANNLIRQLLKSTIGRYRFLRTGERIDLDADVRAELDLDAKSLEEFLISGLVVNRRRIPADSSAHACMNVSPQRIFFSRFNEPDGTDVALFGMLHDFHTADLLRIFANADPDRANQILAHFRYASPVNYASPCSQQTIDFDSPALPDHARVVEIWKKITRRCIHCHDLLHAEHIALPYTPEAFARLRALNNRRRRRKIPQVALSLKAEPAWLHAWMSPKGFLLAAEKSDFNKFPFALRLYPMTDGETHSLVADVAPQQLHINRLIGLLDRVIDHSAKGVLLFPTEQLPDGLSWQDMRRIWADPGGIIPYKRTSRSLSPQMVTSSGWNQGAAEMLRIQLDLFAEVSGLAPSFRGREPRFAGAEAARADTLNASVAMLDIMGAFHAFIDNRNKSLSLS